MSAVFSLDAEGQSRVISDVEAILGQINRHAMPAAARDALDRQARRRGYCERADLARVYNWPTPAMVALIVAEKGPEAAQERWHWISSKELRTLARRGGARAIDADDQ